MFEEVFERKHTLTLDLSTAKVINGHIVTNGDVKSLYNLWLKHAQRNIYEMNDHGKKDTIRNIKLIERTFNKTSEEFKEMFEKVFEKKRLLSLDLSAAKLVCGHIVTNGDVMSLYNLWLKHAQRNIYEMNDHSKREGGKRVYFKNSEDLNEKEIGRAHV